MTEDERIIAFWKALEMEMASWKAITEPEQDEEIPELLSNAVTVSGDLK